MTHAMDTMNVFLTGGAQGLGKSFVDGLLAGGARVVFGDISEAEGVATEQEFVAKYGLERVKFLQFDVTDAPRFEKAFQTAVNHLGYVNLMVNNAGFMVEGLWEKMIELNYTGVVRGTLMAYEHMRKDKGGKGGRIINVSSELGLHDRASTPVYCGTKHAVRAFTSCFALAPDLPELGIEYGILCPGPADTQLTRNIDAFRIRNFDPKVTDIVKKRSAPVERIQQGFLRMLNLDNMNGAILYVLPQEMNYFKMEKFNLGETWPVQKAPSADLAPSVSPKLKTKNVFLTGGAQGLGKGYMEALLAEGAKLVFGDVDREIGTATERELAEKYGMDRVKFIPFDVTNKQKFEEAFDTAIRHLGYVDLMVNNAGFLDESRWEKMIQLNFTGVVRGTLLAFEHMRKDRGGKGGRIINISSDSGLHLVMQVPVYCGTKQAVRSFTTALSKSPDVEEHGVELGTLCPGPSETDLVRKANTTKVRYLHTFSKNGVKPSVASVERVQSAFLKLALLERLNGATLYVTPDEMNFYTVKKVNLGPTWPGLQKAIMSFVTFTRKSAL